MNMGFEHFKKAVEESILDYLPKDKKLEVKIQSVEKVNETLTGIIVSDGGAVCPNLYLEQFFESFKRGKPLDAILREMASAIGKALDNRPKLDKMLRPDRVFFQLVNTELNKDFLQKAPHREFLDLSIIYRVLVDKSEEGLQTCVVTDSVAHEMGLTEENLYKLAYENTFQLMKPKVLSMRSFMTETLGIPDSIIPEEMGTKEWIIRNDVGLYGATVILYDPVLQLVAEQVESDLYLLPSSLHEVIAVSAEAAGGCTEGLRKMVTEVNGEAVAREAKLSNSVYFYNRSKHSFSLIEKGGSLC